MIVMILTVGRKQKYKLDNEERKKVVVQYILEQRLQSLQAPIRQMEPEEIEALLGVFMIDTSAVSFEVDRFLHFQRAKILHKLEAIPGLEVKDWERTDDENPHEVVEIIVALGSAGVITALVNIIKLWIEKDKIDEVTINLPSGPSLVVKGATASEIQGFITTANQLLLSQEAKKKPD